jgi:hypothetical protein
VAPLEETLMRFSLQQVKQGSAAKNDQNNLLKLSLSLCVLWLMTLQDWLCYGLVAAAWGCTNPFIKRGDFDACVQVHFFSYIC